MMNESFNRERIARLGDEAVDFRFKAFPPALLGQSLKSATGQRPRLSEFSTPLLTLVEPALEFNAITMAAWCREQGVLLAPHGKTTMAPSLWARQMELGAWGITLATPFQLRVGVEFGFRKILLANTLSDPHAARWVAGLAGEGITVISWVDSERTVELLEEALDAGQQLQVMLEFGSAGGRTGIRGHEQALRLARRIQASPALTLAGLGGYEGSLAHTWDGVGLAAIQEYLDAFARLHQAVAAEGLYESDQVLLSLGGSAYFDQVVAALTPLKDERTAVVLRSGAYLVHDDGFYRDISPFSRAVPAVAEPFHSAMHAWARVVSQPEPGLAILDVGKRDISFDEGLPEPQLISPGLGEPGRPLRGASITSVNDQHAFLRFEEAEIVRVGDVIRLGLSHPCTALDKWTLIPLISSSDPAQAVVVDAIRTFF